MLTATPGRGRITRVTVADLPGDDTLAARLIPHRNHVADPAPWEDAPPTPADALVNVVRSVDVVLPGPAGVGTTGLVLTLLDEDSARQLGRALYRAAVLLGQRVPTSAFDTTEAGPTIPVEGLPDVTIAAATADA
jgi:hypothetical protein